MNRRINRIVPSGPSHAFKTFSVRTPKDTHTRAASCKEVDCEHYTHGWQLRVEGLPPEMVHLAIHSGRRFERVEVAEGETYLVFEAGQPCFASGTHRVSLDRPEFFLVGRGDYRTFNPLKARRHDNPRDFVDEMQTDLDKLRTLRERG